jgi:two-component system sensor kinase FixL
MLTSKPEAQALSEADAWTLINQVPGLVLLVATNGDVLFANEQARRGAGEPVGRNVLDTHGTAPGTTIDTPAFHEVLSHSLPSRAMGWWPDQHGAPRPIQWRLRKASRSPSAEVCIVATGIDAVTADDAMAALEDADAHLKAVLDTAVDGIITIDQTGIVQSLNKAAERMFGYPASDVIGRNIRMLMPPQYAREHDGYLAAYQATRKAKIIGTGREVEGMRADGHRFPMDLAVSEVRFGAETHYTGIVRDITERRSAQMAERTRLDELAHAARLSAMGEMSSGIAHELNQPLAAMVTFAKALSHMLEADKLEPETLRESLDHIAAQGLRAGGIVSRLQRLARKDTGQYEEVTLNEVVQDVLTLIDHQIRLGGIDLRCILAETLPTVNADRIQIEQVVLNLARNAVDALTEACDRGDAVSQILVSTRLHEQMVEIVVEDNGPGISDDALPHVFDSFFTTKATGIGLGLSISRSILDAHGGQIRCENVPTGGARFILRIPCNA